MQSTPRTRSPSQGPSSHRRAQHSRPKSATEEGSGFTAVQKPEQPAPAARQDSTHSLPDHASPSGRLLALHALTAWRLESLSLEMALEKACRRANSRERSLAWELAFGVIRFRSLLDALLRPILDKPPEQLHALVHDILCLGVYQLRASRSPSFAVVHESVELCRKVQVPWATRVVNAVLRKLERGPELLNLPPLPWGPAVPGAEPLWEANRVGVCDPDQLRQLAPHLTALLLPLCLRHASPHFWVQSVVLERFQTMDPALPGLEELPALLACTVEIPPLVLRVNTSVCTREVLLERFSQAGISARSGQLLPDSLKLESSGAIPALPDFHQGAFWVQDEASQLAAAVLDAQPGETVLDACAAPGGKTFCLAMHVGETGRVFATDISAPRLNLVEESLKRLKLPQVRTRITNWESPGMLAETPATFDRVLLDAPCTGFGVLRRIPEIKWRRTQAEVAQYAQRQLLLLRNLARVVKPGGTLVYCVCSPLPAEGPQVVEAFLSEARSSDIGSWQQTDLTQFIQPELRGMVSRTGAIHSWPHRHGCDAFFIARLTRLAP